MRNLHKFIETPKLPTLHSQHFKNKELKNLILDCLQEPLITMFSTLRHNSKIGRANESERRVKPTSYKSTNKLKAETKEIITQVTLKSLLMMNWASVGH